jgi:hypothetical protein
MAVIMMTADFWDVMGHSVCTQLPIVWRKTGTYLQTMWQQKPEECNLIIQTRLEWSILAVFFITLHVSSLLTLNNNNNNMKIPNLFFLQMTQALSSLAPTLKILKIVLRKSSMT